MLKKENIYIKKKLNDGPIILPGACNSYDDGTISFKSHENSPCQGVSSCCKTSSRGFYYLARSGINIQTCHILDPRYYEDYAENSEFLNSSPTCIIKEIARAAGELNINLKYIDTEIISEIDTAVRECESVKSIKDVRDIVKSHLKQKVMAQMF